MRDILTWTLLIFLITASDAVALESISIGAGINEENIAAYRIEAQKDLHLRWLESRTGFLFLTVNLSVDYWHKDDEDAFATAVIPLLTYNFTFKEFFNPFIEAGVGVSYVSEDMIAGRNLGMHFQFADIFGIGVNLGKSQSHGLRLRLLHYSNAGLDDQNDGITFYMLSYLYHF